MVQMNAFTREPESLVNDQLTAVERVIKSGWWILGKEVESFENEWAKWCGGSYAVGVGNGMDALEIGIRALGIGPGDEIITTPMTAFATVLAILRTGAEPVLADIDPTTAILSTESVVRCFSKKTKAVMVVHLYGQAAPLEEFVILCRDRNIHLIEDCAQAHGAASGDYQVGCAGVFAGWSFYPTKNFGAIGDGGALSTMNPALAHKAKQLRNYGQSERYYHPHIGLNSRLDELHAAILNVRLQYLTEWISRRREIAHRYSNEISNSSIQPLPLPSDPKAHVHHLYVIRSKERDLLAQFLKEKEIETLIHYPVPVHRQKPCVNIRCDPQGLPIAETHAAQCLSLPCNPFLTADEVTEVIEKVNSFKV